jgi:dGTPase
LEAASDLRSYAASTSNSRGRVHPESSPRYRSEFQRDRDRIVHSGAFRRLEYKTQVFVNHEGDMFRTRLTHSIEVAQIARTVARVLGLNEDLTEAICLAHDLGHTPFGHAGQDALNACMNDYGGFEHNLQSLRVVDVLEEKYAEFDGLNLLFETREGILKHCSAKNARTLGEIGTRFLARTQPGLEAQLANVADEIAYNNHDVDDGLRAGLISVEQLRAMPLFAEPYEAVRRASPQLNERKIIHEVIRRMIGTQVEDLIDTTRVVIEELAPKTIDDVRNAPESLVRFSPEMEAKHLELKRFLREALYRHYRVHRMAVKAKRTVQALFDAMMDDEGVMPSDDANHARAEERDKGLDGRARVVADYIAGMTDRYAIAEYQRLYHMVELT